MVLRMTDSGLMMCQMYIIIGLTTQQDLFPVKLWALYGTVLLGLWNRTCSRVYLFNLLPQNNFDSLNVPLSLKADQSTSGFT